MAWKETHVHDERVNFVREVEAGDESIADLCRVYGVSRKTGYKWWARYEQEGVAGLADRSRAPRSHPNAVGADDEAAILALRAQRSSRGERKLHAFLEREHPEQAWPSPSTIGAILKRHGLTYARRRRRHATPSSTLSDATTPNQVWAIDFKGHFRTGDGVALRSADDLGYGQPLSAALSGGREAQLGARAAAVGSDLPRVRVAAGVALRQRAAVCVGCSGRAEPAERVVPATGRGAGTHRAGPPEQNGRHERMHRTLKKETASPPRATARGQQRAFNSFQRDYNEQRPHEALGMATPASVYVPSPREYPARLPEMEYPSRYQLRRVAERGDIHWRNRVVFLSEVLAGETVGLEEDEQGWRIWLGALLLTRVEREHLQRARRTGKSTRPRPRVPAECLGRDSGRPTGSLRRAPNTASREAAEKGPCPGET